MKKYNTYATFTDGNGKEHKMLIGSVEEIMPEITEPEAETTIPPINLKASESCSFSCNIKDSFEVLKEKLDMIYRPIVILMHPSDAEKIRKDVPDIDKRVVIQDAKYMEKGYCIFIKREVWEEWGRKYGQI